MLSGSFEVFPFHEVLGLVKRSGATGALVVRGRDIDGVLYVRNGEFCAAEVADLTGSVDGRHALEVRLLEVCVPLLRIHHAEFQFRPDVAPAWPAEMVIPVDPILDAAQAIASGWSAMMKTLDSFDSRLERTGAIETDSITMSHLAFRVFELVDGHTSIRDLARRARVSLVVVAPELGSLIRAGALRVFTEADRAIVVAAKSGDRPSGAPGVDADRDDPASVPSGFEAVLELAGVGQRASESTGVADLVPVSAQEPEPERAPMPPAFEVPVPPVVAVAVDPAPPTAVRPSETTPPVVAPEPEVALEPAVSVPSVPDAPTRSQIVVERSELLRMFSGLQDD